MTERVVAARAPDVQIVDRPAAREFDVEALKAPDLMREVEQTDSMTAVYDLGPVTLRVAYGETPTIGYEENAELTLTLVSRSDVAIAGDLSIEAPYGMEVGGGGEFSLGRRGAAHHFECEFAADREHMNLQVSNPITARVALEHQEPIIQRFPLCGEHVWLIAGPFEGDLEGERGPETALDPRGQGPWEGRDGPVDFQRRSFPESEMHLDGVLDGQPGTVYALTWLFTSVDTHINLGLDCSGSFRVWVDGEQVGEVIDPPPVRPVRHRYALDVGEGWHPVLVRALSDDGELELHFYPMDDRPEVISGRGHGRTDLINTYLPDEAPDGDQ
jgi:hypothetical protein